MHNQGVLLLNATYEPLTVLSVKRASRLMGKERAVPVTAEQITIEHTGQTMAVPSVLRLKVYVNVPKRNAPRWTRRGVLVRDGNRS